MREARAGSLSAVKAGDAQGAFAMLGVVKPRNMELIGGGVCTIAPHRMSLSSVSGCVFSCWGEPLCCLGSPLSERLPMTFGNLVAPYSMTQSAI